MIKVKQIPLREFYTHSQELLHGAMLSLTHQAFATRCDVQYEEWDEYGLSWQVGAGLEIEGERYMIWASRDIEQYQKICIDLPAGVNQPRKVLEKFFAALHILPEEVEWMNEEFLGKRWQLKRMDDNGNVFVIQNYLDREFAETQRAGYESKGHKQTYWVEEAE